MDPSLLCKAFFCFGTAVDIGGTLFPSFREYIMTYGSRGTDSHISKSQSQSLFHFIASIQVPHTWFTHYYVVSVASSIFWAIQIYSHGPVFEFLASYSRPKDSMTVNQVFLAWLMMAFQGTRRLYESLTLAKSSQSQMWIGLWLIGIAYYAFIGVSVWIEGAGIQYGRTSSLEIGSPSLKTCIAVPIYILASSIQYTCHKHLASLKKYTLPQQYWFQKVVCPHYTSECIIYVAIAIVAAPPGQWLNETVLAGLGFVVSNLGVTADSTRKWYVKKFGAEKLAGRWRMVPYLY
ncbi:3-oxo-5-alpha-steroid 4-dehydrogenase-like protein [Cadophora sp. MPI-SDFR-AT-0126]|nr:3-oxo-5-alpha-steroid 4-dehydrogenase-like protein [Leotiomycetes sp. MPI-SDFR-AT-0126]